MFEYCLTLRICRICANRKHLSDLHHTKSGPLSHGPTIAPAKMLMSLACHIRRGDSP